MSKYPITESQFYGYKSYQGVDSLAWKGVLYTKILIVDKDNQKDYLHLFNTHLQATYSGGVYKANCHSAFESRLNQIIELTDFVHQKMSQVALEQESQAVKHGDVKERHSFVICGDFNVRAGMKYHPSSPEIKWKLKNKDAVEWIKQHEKETFFMEFTFLQNSLRNSWQYKDDTSDSQIQGQLKHSEESYKVDDIYQLYMKKEEINFDDRNYLEFHNKIFDLQTDAPGNSIDRPFFVYPDTASYSMRPNHPKSQFVDLNTTKSRLDYMFLVNYPQNYKITVEECVGSVRNLNVMPLLTQGHDLYKGKVERMSDHNFIHAEFELL